MVAGSLRANHDLIPGIRLPAQIISSQDLLFFALLGATLLVFIESIRTGYISRVYLSFKRIGLLSILEMDISTQWRFLDWYFCLQSFCMYQWGLW
jgi:hypothetical protein